MKSNELSGKVIIVAGGSGGIGSEVCKLLASKGARLIIAGRTSPQSFQLLNEIQQFHPDNIFIEKDLRGFEAWEELIDCVLQRFMQIDILINSIGMINPGSFVELEKNEIENYVHTNLLSIIYGCKAVLPIMKEQQFGHIINIGSLGGIIAMPYETMYSATKFGVRGFTLSLAEELNNTGINVSLISPGPVKTKLLDLESTDDKSTLAFVNKALRPATIAQNVLKIIKQPQREVILPSYAKMLSILINVHSKLFENLFPLLNKIGEHGLKKYRHKYLDNPYKLNGVLK